MTFNPGFAWMSCSFPSRSTTIIRAIEISVKQPLRGSSLELASVPELNLRDYLRLQ